MFSQKSGTAPTMLHDSRIEPIHLASPISSFGSELPLKDPTPSCRRKTALARCLVACLLGLGLVAQAQKTRLIRFDAPGAGTGAYQGAIANGIKPGGAIAGFYVAEGRGDDVDQLAQVALLEELHATFHGAASVHDPVNGDSPAAITQRIRDILAIWTKDGELTIVNSTATAGNYIGNGDPDDDTTCPEPSGDTSATGQQGTLCTFYKYVGGSFQPANKFVSLSPAYNTKFVPVRDKDGQWTSSVYFECHYFNVALNPATGLPFWTAVSHVDLDGEARKIDGQWLLTHASAATVGVPVP